MNAQLVLLAWTFDPLWSIPVMGGAVCALAYLFGRRFLTAKPPSSGPVPAADNFLLGVTTERRATPRRKGNLIGVVLSAEGASELVAGWVVDRSIGGLCLLLDQAVREGATYKLRARGVPETTLWTPVLIRSCRAEGEQWEVGCQFIHTPSWNVLLHFG